DARTRAELTRHVDVFIGTGGHGHTFPGATLPFGMVQLSPDTYNAVWDSCSGYHESDGSIMGFSHTHLSGTGIGDMLDFLLVPATGEVKLVPGALDAPDSGYRSRY
ncbi:MAG: alpha-mannosidase, partial [Xanthomonas perforans]|nr:alpha-mannosidase [Xanthomonas perforans]